MTKQSVQKIVLFLILFILGVLSGRVLAQEKKEMKPALLVIDIQKVYLDWMAEQDTALAMPRIRYAVQLFHKAGLPVIRIYHDDPDSDPKPEDPAFQFPGSSGVTDKDPKIIKNHGNAYVDTGLDVLLKEKGVNTVFLCGLSSVGCVLATHFGAGDHGYESFLIKDALMSHNADYTDSIEDIFGAIDLKTMRFMIHYLTP